MVWEHFLVDRNYMTDDLEVVKLIDMSVVNEHRKYPVNAKKLMRSYPSLIVGYQDNYILFKDGSKLLFDDHKEKSMLELLTNPSVDDQFFFITIPRIS